MLSMSSILAYLNGSNILICLCSISSSDFLAKFSVSSETLDMLSFSLNISCLKISTSFFNSASDSSMPSFISTRFFPINRTRSFSILCLSSKSLIFMLNSFSHEKSCCSAILFLFVYVIDKFNRKNGFKIVAMSAIENYFNAFNLILYSMTQQKRRQDDNQTRGNNLL